MSKSDPDLENDLRSILGEDKGKGGEDKGKGGEGKGGEGKMRVGEVRVKERREEKKWSVSDIFYTALLYLSYYGQINYYIMA